ncbi:MAG: nucleotide exchange factor GrpE [Nanobdellota archaeon]
MKRKQSDNNSYSAKTESNEKQSKQESKHDSTQEQILSESEDVIVELQERLREKEDAFLRLQAEFENFRKRTELEKQNTYDRALRDVFKKIVGVFDDFDLALSHKQDGQSFRKGMELIYAKLYGVAEDEGLKKIDTVGQQFDPQRHEAMLAQESDKPSQEIIEELQPGYSLNNVIVRTAKVKVSK